MFFYVIKGCYAPVIKKQPMLHIRQKLPSTIINLLFKNIPTFLQKVVTGWTAFEQAIKEKMLGDNIWLNE